MDRFIFLACSLRHYTNVPDFYSGKEPVVPKSTSDHFKTALPALFYMLLNRTRDRYAKLTASQVG